MFNSKRNRAYSMVLTLLLISALLTSCGTDTNSTDNAAATSTDSGTGAANTDVTESTQHIGDLLFSLDGVDYYSSFTVQTLIDNGWVIGDGVGFIDAQSANPVAYSFRMTCGESQITVTLNQNAITQGADPAVCRPETLNVYGDGATSFVVSGAELIGVTGSQLVERLGDPSQTHGFTHIYFEPVDGIDLIMFSFTDAQSTVDQITVGIK